MSEEAKMRYSDASELKFKLCAVTSHVGDSVRTVRVGDGWYRLDDSMITRREGVDDLDGDAVLLMYERLPDLGDSRAGRALTPLLGRSSCSKASTGDL
ncbi:hypothetical protein B484DRAFT_412147 [Ochromonadaceae sp. CCMP2298]|nr:hypothetical protein B484DRAFT_412147 [Ochromonadaceae sp. CCMP2298]